jgi:hypothetical protein
VQALRDFLLERASQCGVPTTQKLITSLRAFLRVSPLPRRNPL